MLVQERFTWVWNWVGVVLVVFSILRLIVVILRNWSNRKSVEGKIVVVTGASQGIGKATALECARRGASKVVIMARTASKLTKVSQLIDEISPNTCVTVPVDCSDYKQVDAAAEQVLEKVGVPYMIVNNVGVGQWRSLTEQDGADIEFAIGAPYLAAAFVSRAFLPSMLRANQGAIVCVNSVAGCSAWGGCVSYMSARWALAGFSRALRADLYRTKISVHEVVLGKVSSQYFANNPGSEERIPSLGSMIPTMTPRQAGEAILGAVQSGREFSAHPPLMQLTVWIRNWVPSFFDWLATRTAPAQPLPGREKRE